MCSQQEFRRPQLLPDSPVKPPKLEMYMPATPPLAFMATVEFWIRVFRRRHHFRRLFLPLLKEEDQILSDIGFERKDIQWALRLPLKVDALKALEACRKARRESEMPVERMLRPLPAQQCPGTRVSEQPVRQAFAEQGHTPH